MKKALTAAKCIDALFENSPELLKAKKKLLADHQTLLKKVKDHVAQSSTVRQDSMSLKVHPKEPRHENGPFPSVDLLTYQHDPIDSATDVLEISVATKRLLFAEGIFTLRKLTKTTEVQLLKSPRFGRRAINEIKEALYKHGLTLGVNR